MNKIFSLGFVGSCRLLVNLVITKLFFPRARIVRWPFYIRNEGSLVIGKGFSSNPGLVIDVFGITAQVVISDDVMVNYRLHIGSCSSIFIGSNTLIGSDCLIIDHSHGDYSSDVRDGANVFCPPVKRPLSSKAIHIGRNCWLGDRVSVLSGVNLGDGVVVGAGSVVTKSFPANVMIAGAPAKIIKSYDSNTGKWIRVK